jgi:hypothetical protein
METPPAPAGLARSRTLSLTWRLLSFMPLRAVWPRSPTSKIIRLLHWQRWPSRAHLHPKKRFPRAPRAPPRVETSFCIDMSIVQTESRGDLETLESSSMLCIHQLELNAPCQQRALYGRQLLPGTPIPACTVISMIYGPAGMGIKWMGIAARPSVVFLVELAAEACKYAQRDRKSMSQSSLHGLYHYWAMTHAVSRLYRHIPQD